VHFLSLFVVYSLELEGFKELTDRLLGALFGKAPSEVRAGLGLARLLRLQETTESSVVEGKGEPCLVVELLDADGEPERARLVVDQALYAWDIADDGTVSPRGDLS
jgi:hypothetical protein